MNASSQITPGMPGPLDTPDLGPRRKRQAVRPDLRRWQWLRMASLAVNLVCVCMYVFLLLGYVGGGVSSGKYNQSLLNMMGLCLLLCACLTVMNAVMLYIPIGWDCPGCPARLNAGIAWKCPACRQGNCSWWSSFLFICGHFDCRRAPTAFRCPHCSTLTYLTPHRSEERTAMALSDPAAEEKVPSRAEVRQEKREVHADTMEDSGRRHELIEETRKRLNAEIEIARLRRRRAQEAEPPVTEHQRQINEVAGKMEEFREKVRSTADVVQFKAEMMAWIESQGYPPTAESDFKRALGMKFDDWFRDLIGAEIRTDEKENRL